MTLDVSAPAAGTLSAMLGRALSDEEFPGAECELIGAELSVVKR